MRTGGYGRFEQITADFFRAGTAGLNAKGLSDLSKVTLVYSTILLITDAILSQYKISLENQSLNFVYLSQQIGTYSIRNKNQIQF